LYEPFSGEALHHNYSDQLLRHFGLLSNSRSFAVFFEEPHYGAFKAISLQMGDEAEWIYSENIVHSLATYALWRSGLMGSNEDPIDMADDKKCGLRDFLKTHDYDSLRLRLPSSTQSLNFEDVLSYAKYENLDGRLSSTYFGHDDTYVEHFWGNIPEIEFSETIGLKPTGRLIGQLFAPEMFYAKFKNNDGVGTYFSEQFDYYFNDGLIGDALGYDKNNPQSREQYRKRVISFWVFAITQGLTTNLVLDIYKMLRG